MTVQRAHAAAVATATAVLLAVLGLAGCGNDLDLAADEAASQDDDSTTTTTTTSSTTTTTTTTPTPAPTTTAAPTTTVPPPPPDLGGDYEPQSPQAQVNAVLANLPRSSDPVEASISECVADKMIQSFGSERAQELSADHGDLAGYEGELQDYQALLTYRLSIVSCYGAGLDTYLDGLQDQISDNLDELTSELTDD